MTTSINVFITVLLSCLLFVRISADDRILKYRVNSTTYIHIEPDFPESIVSQKFDIFLKPDRKVNNTYIGVIRNAQISIERQNVSTVNLETCLSMVQPIISLWRPFLIVLNNEGLLQHIKVHNLESELSINLKYIISSILQVNRTMLRQPNNIKGNELILTGFCPVKYKIKKEKKSSNETLRINKSYDLKSCTNIDKENRSIHCLGNSCNLGSEKKSSWKATANLQVKLKNKSPIIEFISLNDYRKYKPWRNSSKVVILDGLTEAELEPVEVPPLIPPFINIHTSALRNARYRAVDESICDKGNSKDLDLKLTYKGLICDRIAENYYLDLYEKAINCWKIL